MTAEQLKAEAKDIYGCLWEDVEQDKRPDFEQWYKDINSRIYLWKGWRINTRHLKRSFFKYLKQKKYDSKGFKKLFE